MQFLIPEISCNLAKLDFQNWFFAHQRFLEASKCKSEARFELSMKKQVYLRVQTMLDVIFDKSLISSFP